LFTDLAQRLLQLLLLLPTADTEAATLPNINLLWHLILTWPVAAIDVLLPAECTQGTTTVTGPAGGSVCAAAVTKTFTYSVSSGRAGVNVEAVTVSASAGVRCSVAPNTNSK
jgi:hypothetical protein